MKTMNSKELSEQMSLMKQRQDFLEKTVIKHMEDEEKNTEELKATQSIVFKKIDTMQETIVQNTIDISVGLKSIKSTIIIVGTVLGILFGMFGTAIAFSKILS